MAKSSTFFSQTNVIPLSNFSVSNENSNISPIYPRSISPIFNGSPDETTRPLLDEVCTPILPNDSAISVRITPGRIPIHMKVLRKTNPRSSYRPSGHNPENCIAVQTKLQEKSGSSNLFVPSILLSNVMSLAPKIDELREVSKQIDVDLICITESWLQNHIHDNVVEISGYNIVRRDRYQGEHGGVCVYVKNFIKYDI